MKKRSILLVALLINSSILLHGCESFSNNEDSTYKVDTGQASDTPVNEPFETALALIQPQAYTNIHDLNVDPEMTISLIAQDESASYWTSLEEGAQKAVDDINEYLEFSDSDKLSLNFNAPEETGSIEEQVNILDEEAARYPLAIGISTAETGAFEVQLDLAIENGIPIIAFDSITDYANISSTIGSNKEVLCTSALSNLAEQIDKTGKILCIADSDNSSNSIAMKETLTTQLAASYPDIQLVEFITLDDLTSLKTKIVDERNYGIVEESHITIEEISDQDVLNYHLENHSDIAGFLTLDETSNSLLLETLDSAKKDYDYFSILSFGSTSEQVDALNNGKIEGLMVENPFGTGYATVVAALRASLGLANESFVDTGFTYVTQDNFEDLEIQHLLY